MAMTWFCWTRAWAAANEVDGLYPSSLTTICTLCPPMPPFALTDEAQALTTSVVWEIVEASGPVQLQRSPMTNGALLDAAPAGWLTAPVIKVKPAARAIAQRMRPPGRPFGMAATLICMSPLRALRASQP